MSIRSNILTFALACFATACVGEDIATVPEDPTPEVTSDTNANFTCKSLLDTSCMGFIGDNAVTAVIQDCTLTNKEQKALAKALDNTETMNKKDADPGDIINGVTINILNFFTANNNGNFTVGNIIVCLNTDDQDCTAN
jgi:hypothetical protein